MNDVITQEDALKVLDFHRVGRFKKIHTFTGIGPFLVGCDISVHAVRKYLKDAKDGHIRISGKNMSAVGHSVGVYIEQRDSWLFLATKESFNKLTRRLKR